MGSVRRQGDFKRFGCTTMPWLVLLASRIDPSTFATTWPLDHCRYNWTLIIPRGIRTHANVTSSIFCVDLSSSPAVRVEQECVSAIGQHKSFSPALRHLLLHSRTHASLILPSPYILVTIRKSKLLKLAAANLVQIRGSKRQLVWRENRI